MVTYLNEVIGGVVHYNILQVLFIVDAVTNSCLAKHIGPRYLWSYVGSTELHSEKRIATKLFATRIYLQKYYVLRLFWQC